MRAEIPRHLLAGVRVNLIFYRRNRLLLVIVALLGFVFIASLIPSLLFETSTQRFAIVKTIFESLNLYFFLFSAALGLLAASSHLRDRSIKMVATKPLAPELWLLSHFASAGLVFLALSVANLLLAAGLMLVWGIPFQWGVLYLAVTAVCRCLILFSYLTFLSVLFHPAVAGLTVLILQEEMFYQLSLLAASGRGLVESSLYKAFMLGVEKLLFMLYAVLPIYTPFADVVARIQASYRVGGEDLVRLLLTLAYTLVLSTLLYLLSAASLRKRRFV